MKIGNLIVTIVLSVSAIGCSSLGGWIPRGPVPYAANGVEVLSPLHPELAHKDRKSYEVLNHNPYAINIGFEDSGSDPMRIPARGDGGASLNAYATCLTLKVMF